METDTYMILETWIKENENYSQDENSLLDLLKEQNEDFLFGFILSLLV
ncbi:hypothetical protein Q5O14_06355 [Eubacteriaceae bacterium ES2]|nr:hypothetical protein Q5O14_06355 [Eubacteriaceae bacterium ES2]